MKYKRDVARNIILIADSIEKDQMITWQCLNFEKCTLISANFLSAVVEPKPSPDNRILRALDAPKGTFVAKISVNRY
jgi:hypothetical protein